MVEILLQFRIQTWRTIFEKSSHLREKGGVLVLFKTTRHSGTNAQYMYSSTIFLLRILIMNTLKYESANRAKSIPRKWTRNGLEKEIIRPRLVIPGRII